MKRVWLAVAVLALVVVGQGACLQILGGELTPDLRADAGSVGGTGGTGSTTTTVSTSTSSSSGNVECTSPAMCGTDTPCVAWACDNGDCVSTKVTKGDPCLGQTGVCEGGGMCVLCTKDGSTVFGCPTGEDCVGGLCTGCTNGTLDSNETDIDCGGTCAPCAEGKACKVGTDCVGGACDAGSCAALSCTDGVENGNETDVDCGGPCPNDCGTGKKCNTSGDCVSKVCTGSGQKTCKAPTCTDNVQNGTETDQDCGGAGCPKCTNGDKCLVNGDCMSAHCVGLTCVDACFDLVKDGTETDVDCGGSCTANCALGKGCMAGNDCISGFCNITTMLCVMQCADGVKQANEADIDCGGACTTKCATGKMCLLNADCATGVCLANVCM